MITRIKQYQMVQQTVDSKFNEYDPESSSPNCDKQPPVGVKKTPLRDLQNDNRIVPKSTGSSPFSKDRGPIIDPIKVSGAKRASPECLVSPSQYQLRTNSPANEPLVYVRRKSEVEFGKSNGFDSTSISNFQQLRQGQTEEINQERAHIKEPKVSCFPAFATLPMASSTSSSAKPAIPLPLGKSAMRLGPSEYNQHRLVSAAAVLDSPNEFKKLHFEQRYYELQMLLKKLDQSHQDDYIQMLRSLPVVDLSRHGIELEKRSIQLSLEEAKEMQRVGVLNVLGKTKKMAKSPSGLPEQ